MLVPMSKSVFDPFDILWNFVTYIIAGAYTAEQLPRDIWKKEI